MPVSCGTAPTLRWHMVRPAACSAAPAALGLHELADVLRKRDRIFGQHAFHKQRLVIQQACIQLELVGIAGILGCDELLEDRMLRIELEHALGLALQS